MSRKRQFTEESIHVFNYLLQKESWQSFLSSDVNTSFDAFMDMILHHYNTAFSLKTAYMSKIKNKWITQGIRNSCKRMKLLNGLKKQQTLPSDMVEYITRYQIIYKKVIKEAKKTANDKYVSRAQNKMKAVAFNK
jgi:hypothetical protein